MPRIQSIPALQVFRNSDIGVRLSSADLLHFSYHERNSKLHSIVEKDEG